ncbi:MAG: hypothetical protein JKY52_07075 [Flavobacteriales bacterium]|nr:hypothetical protein [Flavobacteriales bacterium]
MNKIEAKQLKSKYWNGEHLALVIDGEPLDHIIDKFDRDEQHQFNGLVPTLLDCLDNEDEQSVVWARILPDIGQTTKTPILMCPDDCDFWCTIIIAEVERTYKEVKWLRIGSDIGKAEGLPDSIGTHVDWFDGLQFTFSLPDYKECLWTFEKEIIKTVNDNK